MLNNHTTLWIIHYILLHSNNQYMITRRHFYLIEQLQPYESLLPAKEVECSNYKNSQKKKGSQESCKQVTFCLGFDAGQQNFLTTSSCVILNTPGKPSCIWIRWQLVIYNEKHKRLLLARELVMTQFKGYICFTASFLTEFPLTLYFWNKGTQACWASS